MPTRITREYDRGAETESEAIHVKRRKLQHALPKAHGVAPADGVEANEGRGVVLDAVDEAHDAAPAETCSKEGASTALAQASRSRLGHAQQGVVERVELRNFMCHSHLVVDFGPNINFVVGHNGSGKSAILTALSVCLGAKASSTNRGSNMRTLVKEGKDVASVIVVLKNRGADAFKPDVYGERISIERIISAHAHAHTGYKLRNASGHIVSRKKEELDEILDHTAIDVANPLNVLNQDVAKQFLGNSSPEAKYELFMQGVLLNQLQRDYSLIEQSIVSARAKLQAQSRDLVALEEAAKRAQDLFEETRNIRAIQDELDDLKNEMAWAQVKEKEANVREYEEHVDRAQRKMEKILAEQKEAKRSIEEFEMHRQRRAERLRTHLSTELAALERELETCESDSMRWQREFRELNSSARDADASVRETRGEIREIDEALAKEREAATRELEQEKARIDLQVSDKDKEMELLRCRIEEISREKGDLRREVEERQQRQRQLSEKRAKAQNNLEAAREQLSLLEQAKEGRLAAYGPNVSALLAAIDSHKSRFEGDVVGPIGLYLDVKVPIWSGTLESFFGKTLNGYLVETHADRQLLLQLMRRHGVQATVNVLPRGPMDFSSGEPSPEFTTIARACTFRDEWVLNLLVIRNSVESIILIEDRAQADQVMYSRPKNVIVCYALDPGGEGSFAIGGKKGASATFLLDRYRGPPRLIHDMSQDIARYHAEISALRDEISQCQTDIKASVDAMSSLDNRERALTRENMDIHRKVNSLKFEVELLRNSLESHATIGVRIATLEDSQREAQQVLRSYESQLAEINAQIRGAQDSLRALQDQRENVTRLVQEVKSKIAQEQRTVDEIISEIDKAKAHLLHWEGAMQKQVDYKAQLEADLVKAREIYADANELAREICDEVPVHQSASQLDRKIAGLVKKVEQHQRQLGKSVEEIALEMRLKRDQYEQARAQFTALDRMVALLQRTMDARQHRWQEFRTLITLRTKNMFQENLLQRGFTGRLVIKHDTRTLDAIIQPHEVDRGSATSVRGLSGGEKSYSTVCLLLAVWNAMSSPIRCLDEFDVFMDAVNRSISMDMLIKAASATPDVQYIFLTPQSMTAARQDNVKVIRLSDPRTQQG